MVLHLQHHDRSTLLAGKLHAVLQRPYLKGRDVFDLAWYLADPTWPAPNLELLNNALRQTAYEGPVLGERTWRKAVRDRLALVEWPRIQTDVRPFIEPGGDPALLRAEVLAKLLA